MTEIIKSYTTRRYPVNALSDSGTYSDDNLTYTSTITNGTDISGTQYGGGNCIVKYSSYKTDTDNNLIVHYKFDDNSTNMLLDSTSNGNNLTNYNTTFDNTNYKIGNGSVYFNGNSQYIEMPSTINPYTIWNNNGISFSIWFNMSSTASPNCRIIDFSSDNIGTTPTNYILIYKDGTQTDKINIVIVAPNGANTYLSPTLNSNTWHHIVWTISSSGVWGLYINNVYINPGITRGIPNVIWTRRWLGRSGFASDPYYTGNIDDFRIYNKVITESEVNTIYNNIISGTPVQLPPYMTNFSTTINNIIYRACAYDYFPYTVNGIIYDFFAWQAFDNIIIDNRSSRYSSQSNFNGDGTLSISGVTFGNDINYRGVYIGIDMGQKINMKSYYIKKGFSPNNTNNRNPKNWKIYATNNDACWNSNGGYNSKGSLNTSSAYDWVEIDIRSNETTYIDTIEFTLNNNKFYRYYALHVNAIISGDQYGGYLDISKWDIFGIQTLSIPKPWIIFKNDPTYYKKIDISSSEPNWNGNYDTVSPYSYMDVSTYLLNNFTGEYITIKLPQKIYLNKYILCSTIDKLTNAPQHFRIYGSLDGINWTQLVERQLTTSSYVNTLIPNSTYSTGYYTDQETKSTIAYDYYGIVVNKLLGPLDASNNKLSFSLWNIYGTNDLKGKSYFEFGVVRDTSKTLGSSLNDGLIRTNNSNIFIKSGNANTAALTIGSNNKIAIGKNIANEVLDISGSLIASEFRIINQSYPIIDSSSNIYVSGNVDISGNLTLNNDKFVINSSNGNLLIGGTLDVSKNININNNKTIIDSSGNIKSQGNFDLSNNININNNVTIDTSGSMIINNTLDISNNATLRNNLDVKGNIKSNALTTNSAINKVSIRNTSVDPSYNFHVTGNTRLEGNLDIDGNIILVDTIQQTSEQFIINNDGDSVALVVNQIGAQPIIDLRDDDQSVFYLADNGLLGLGTTTPNYTVDVSGSCYIQQILDVSGDLIIGGNTYFSESIQLNDILDISQNLNINDKFFIDPSGNIDICGNVLIYGYLISNGNNANSGGFQQEGDANINGNLRVLYNIDISQNLRVLDTFIIDTSGNIKSKGKFDLSNNLSNSNKFSINDLGNIYSKENIDISKNFNINNGVFSADVSGNIIVNGFIDISKNLYVNGNKFSIDQNGNISSQGNIDISNNFSINNKFIVDIDGNIKSTGNLDISNNFIINGNKFKIDNSGNISSQGNFDISDNMTINNTNFIVSNTGNIKSKGTIDISNNFNINNNFNVDNSGNIVSKGNFDILTSLSTTLSFKISGIATSGITSYFIRESDGAVFGSGSSDTLQFGVNQTSYINNSYKIATPIQIKNINNIGFLTGITQVSANYFYSFSGFALLLRGSDGVVFAMGSNHYGNFGNGIRTNHTGGTEPSQVKGENGVGFITGITQISAGYAYSLFLRGSDGAVFGCGFDDCGQLGTNVIYSNNLCLTLQRVKDVDGIQTITGITQISAGQNHALFLRGSDGAVFASGDNSYGILGNGTTVASRKLVQVKGVDGIGFITGITQISAGGYHSLFLRESDGSVFGCGMNTYGALGIDNYNESYTTLQQVKGVNGVGFITGITQIAAGVYHSLFLRGSDGAVFSSGGSGALGTNNGNNSKSLQQVKGVDGIGYITGITKITAKQFVSLFLRDDGVVFGCGNNLYGQLGIGNFTAKIPALKQLLDENGNIPQVVSNNTITYSVVLDKINIDISGNVNSSGSLDISQNLKIGSSLLTVDYLNKRVGVNKTNPEYSLDVSGQIVTNKTILGSSSYVEVTDTNTIDTSTAIIKVNNTQITPTKITLNQYLYAFTSTTSNYTFTCTEDITCDILMIGGGGGGGGNSSTGYGGGGAGALVFMKSAVLPIGTYTLYVGNGGSGGVSGTGNKGGETKITLNGTDVLVAEGGGAGGGGNGGSGGGGNTNPGIANNPGTSKIVYYGVTGIKYGNNGAAASEGDGGGGGGGGGTAGIVGNISSSNRAYGGDGRTNAIINNITYDFVNVFGTNTYGINNDNNNIRYFAGGGGGYYYNITQSNIIEPVLSITPVSIDTNYKYLTFTNDGSENQITYTINFPENTECDILLVGGGGGGGQQNGGGGGAGGLVLIQNFQANGNYTIKVGKGGNGGISGGGNGGVGNNSTFVKSDNSVIITANGGGGGGGGTTSASITATNGGSGGGGGWSSVNGVQTQKSQSQIGIVSPATLNQFGEDGGHGGGDSNSYPGGGGGGAGGVGVTSTSNTTGQNGGSGIDRVGTFIFSENFSSSIGHSGWFGGGGGSGGDGSSSGYGNGGNGLYGGGGNGTIIISNNTNYVINTKNHLSSPGETLLNTPNITRWYTYNNDVLTNVVISTDNWNVEQPGTAATTHDFTWNNNTNYLSAYSTSSTDHYGCWGVNLTKQISYSLNNITYNKHYLLIKDINAIELTTIAFKGRSDSTRDTGWLPKHFKIFGTNFNKTDITTTDITNNEWVELTEIKYKTNPYFVSFHKSRVGNINSNTFTSDSINTNFDIYNWTNTTQTFNTFLFMVIDIGAQDTVMNMDQIAFRGIFGNTSSSTSVGINGINGTGGGGGSIRNSSTTSGGKGGSGIAIIRYKFTKTITTTSSINNSGKGGGGSTGIVGVSNTGGGGGSGSNNPQQPGAAGGSGLILFKFNYPYIKSYNTIYNNDATFGYRNTSTTFNPAIVQLNSGQTFINSLSQYINFNFENVNKCKMDSSGNLILNGDIFIYSDGRIKENITPITSALDKVNDLSGITYNIINKPKRQIGVIAQEVEKVLPEVIKNDGELKTVAYPNMIGLLIEALKELNDKVDQNL